MQVMLRATCAIYARARSGPSGTGSLTAPLMNRYGEITLMILSVVKRRAIKRPITPDGPEGIYHSVPTRLGLARLSNVGTFGSATSGGYSLGRYS